MKMVKKSALLVTIKANKNNRFRRKSKRPFFYNNRMNYPRLIDAEKNQRRGERIVYDDILRVFVILKDRRFKNKSFKKSVLH